MQSLFDIISEELFCSSYTMIHYNRFSGDETDSIKSPRHEATERAETPSRGGQCEKHHLKMKVL